MEAEDGTVGMAWFVRFKHRWVVVGATAFVVSCIVMLGFGMLRAASALGAAATQVQTLQDQLGESDIRTTGVTLKNLQADTETARERTTGPMWSLAGHLPLVGDDVRAVQTVSASIDRIANEALPHAVKIGDSASGGALSPRNGRIDPSALERIRPALTASSGVLTREQAVVGAIDPRPLIGPLESRVRDLQLKLDDAAGGAKAAATASELAPALLGTDTPRRYFVMFQNNAEIRSTGGLAGAFVFLDAEDGLLTIDAPGSSGDLSSEHDPPAVKLTLDEELIYPSYLGSLIHDTTFTPDFPRVAEIARAIVDRKMGTKVDGVLSVDPVALSYLLRGSGSVTLDDGTVLTPDNAVKKLLNEPYLVTDDNAQQDRYFASATQRVFEKVSSGGNPRETVRAMAQATSERHLMFWSAHEDEQAKIAGTSLANELPRREKTPQIGVYLNDATLAKMQYYLRFNTKVRSVKCSDNGIQTLVSTTELTSTAPADAASLPVSVTGLAEKSAKGNQVLVVRVYGTAGGRFDSVTLDGKRQQLYALRHHGRPVTYALVTLKPRQTSRLVARSVTAKNMRDDGVLLTTPGIEAFRNASPILSSCP